MSNIDLPEPNDKDLTFKTIIIPQGESAENDNSESKPFRLIVYKPEVGRITMEKYPKEKNVQYALNSYCDNSSAYCNSNDALYMSGGEKENKPTKDFWKISHDRDVLDYKQMPCCKKNHSMIYIPNNCIFMVGGNSKNTFYYDTKKDIFCKWAELNEPVDKPALALVDNRYLYSFPNNSCEFERSDLKATPSWEKVSPTMKDGVKFNLKNYNVGTDKYGNVILYGGDNEDDDSGYYYVYDPKTNEMEQSIGFNSYVVAKDKQFYPINNYNSVLFPKNFEDDNSIYVMKKNGNVQPFKFNIEQNEKNIKDYIDYKDPAKEIDGKLVIKTREEAIPITNDVELMKKQKNKQPIDYAALSPYLKGIIKGLKEKEELKKKEEEAAKPEDVGDDIIINNDDQFGNITDPDNPTVLKSKWTKPRNIVKLGIPRLAKRSKELEPIKEPEKERENVKIEEMERIETDVEPKKEQEEEDKPIQKKKNDLTIPKSAYGNNIKREVDDNEEPFDVDNNNPNINQNKRYKKGETLPLPKKPDIDFRKKGSGEIAEAPDDDDDEDINKKKAGLRDVKTVDPYDNKYNIEEPDFDVDNNPDNNVETENQDYDSNRNNRPEFLKEIISKSPDDEIHLNLKKIRPDNMNIYEIEGVIPGQKGKEDLINPENEERKDEKQNIHTPNYYLSGEIEGDKKPDDKDKKDINISGTIPGVVDINAEEPEINVKPPKIQANIHKPDEETEFDDSIISGEIKGINKSGLINQKPNINKNTININAPKVDVNVKKPEVDYGISGEIPGVKKPEAKINVNPPKVEIPKQKVEITAPNVDVNVKKPEVDYGISGEIPGVKKPEAKINVNPPKIEIPKKKVEVTAPKVDVNVKKPEVDYGISGEIPGVKKPEAKINVNPPKIEIPKKKVEVTAPKVDVNVKKPEVDYGISGEIPGVKKPEAKVNVNPPKIQLPKKKVEVTQPEIKGNLDIVGDVPEIEKKIDPSLKQGGKGSGNINIEAPKIEIKTEPPKVKVETPKIKIPEAKAEIKTEPQKIKVPELKPNKKTDIINLEYEKPSIPNFSGGQDFVSPYAEIEKKDSLKKGKVSLTNPKEETSPRSKPESRISLVKPKEKDSSNIKQTAPRISLKPNKNSGNTSLENDSGDMGKTRNIQVPRLTKRMEKSFSNSSDLDYEGDTGNLRLSKGINVDGSGLLTLTQLMSLDVNDPINLDSNWIREKKWNKYGGYEIGVPDYHLVYENRGNEGDGNVNVNIEGGDINIDGGQVNVKGGKYGISSEGMDVEDIGFNNDVDGGEYNINIDHMGYSQPMNFDVEIPEDLNAIPNSKVKTRVHKPKPRAKPSINAVEYDEEGKLISQVKLTLPPSKTDEAYVMNYSTLPPFHYTITQVPKENIPICKQWQYYEYDLGNLADYNPKL